MWRDSAPLSIINFYYRERTGKLCLTVDNNLIAMHPAQGMMACFSVSGPNILFDIENMGRNSVSLLTDIFLLWGERSKVVSDCR